MAEEPKRLKRSATKSIEDSPAGKKAGKSPEKTYTGKAARTPAGDTNIGQIATGKGKATNPKPRPKKVRKSKKRF